jgi:hypothetical protein
MSPLIGIEQDIEPLVASIEAFGSATARADRVRLLGQIRDQLEKLRTADEESTAKLEAFYEGDSKGNLSAGQAVLASRENESAAAEMLLSRILSLRRYLTDTSRLHDPQAHQLLQKAVDVAAGYIAGHENLRDQLVAFAERRAAAEEIRRVRLVEGKIDHRKLTREIIARFPKVLAELAK